MASLVLDASAMLAGLQSESGGDAVMELLRIAPMSIAISSVNYAEVTAKLVRDGATREQVTILLEPFNGLIHAFSPPQALTSAFLIQKTVAHGLSLADRACLSLAMELNVPAWTTDRAWGEID